MVQNKYVNKYTISTFGIKQKAAVILGVLLIVLFYFMFFHVDKTPYGYDEISPKLDEYLKTAEPYAVEYNKADKLIVMYYHKRDKDKHNTYPNTFRNEIESAKEDPKFAEYMTFKTFRMLKNTILFDGEKGEAIVNGENELKKVCRDFCIINPKKKAVYFYFKPAIRDTQYLNGNLEKLQFWGAKLD